MERRRLCALAVSLVCGGRPARAQSEWRAKLAPVPVESPNRIAPTVRMSVRRDARSGLYTYRYVISSSTRSRQQIQAFYLPLHGSEVTDVRSPRGWDALIGDYGIGGGAIGWCACAEEGIVLPPGAEDSLREIPSIFQIKPGRALSGFSFRSRHPPLATHYFAGGFVQIPVEGVDFAEGQEPQLPGFPANQFKGRTRGPAPGL